MLSVIFILGITNAFNLIDGLDGLAAGLAFVGLILLAYTFLSLGASYFYLVSISIALCGALLGFLRYNIWKATIFMGDTGSLLCGYILSFLLIKTINLATLENRFDMLLVAFFCVMIPSVDMIRVFFIRVFNGKSPLAADRNHLHHRLMDIGFNSLQIVVLLITFTLLISLTTLWLNHYHYLYSLVFLTGGIFIFFTGIELVYLNKK
jgi:UDP-N-acetylmuramyl pentapeptide phosphotransferase/UDP-N-acetylglucosamine-1-phosphate transferase